MLATYSINSLEFQILGKIKFLIQKIQIIIRNEIKFFLDD